MHGDWRGTFDQLAWKVHIQDHAGAASLLLGFLLENSDVLDADLGSIAPRRPSAPRIDAAAGSSCGGGGGGDGSVPRISSSGGGSGSGRKELLVRLHAYLGLLIGMLRWHPSKASQARHFSKAAEQFKHMVRECADGLCVVRE